MHERLRSLVSKNAILPWLLVLWNILNHLSTLDFVVSKREYMLKAWMYLQNHDRWYLLIGFLWLGALVLWPKRKAQSSAVAGIAQLGGQVRTPRITQEPAPIVEISSPTNGAEVLLFSPVNGTVSPPDRPLQVLVHAANGLWYLQGKPKVEGPKWSVVCQFGEKYKLGNSYEVVAIYGEKITQPTLQFLPEHAVKSNFVHVRRTHAEPRPSEAITKP
jgi:hypothetical protein